ncbi:hypothetical protein JCM10207_001209 [Rhodosporidiobolus poonsookiae]
MLVFVTGASGFIGQAVVSDLLSHGHTVLALARNDSAAAKFDGKEGVEVHRGSLDNPDSLKEGAKKADAVVHLAFKHDFENFQANANLDAEVTKALVSALSGTTKPLLIASGVATFAWDPTRDAKVPAKEDDRFPDFMLGGPRIASEQALLALAAQGGRPGVVRLPPSVHGEGDHGFVDTVVQCAKKHGVSPFVGEGVNFWPAVHREDAASAFRLALEKAPAGEVSYYHAVADGDGLVFKDIAQLVGDRLNVPVKSISEEEAPAHFGFLAMFATLHILASAEKTKEVLGWKAVKPTLREELEAGVYC